MFDSVRPHSPPGSPVPGILQARTLEWVACSFSNAWKWKVKVKSLSRVRLFATPWIAAHQAPPPMGFSRQKYWSGLPVPSPIWGDNVNKGSSIVTNVLFWCRMLIVGDCIHFWEQEIKRGFLYFLLNFSENLKLF